MKGQHPKLLGCLAERRDHGPSSAFSSYGSWNPTPPGFPLGCTLTDLLWTGSAEKKLACVHQGLAKPTGSSDQHRLTWPHAASPDLLQMHNIWCCHFPIPW